MDDEEGSLKLYKKDIIYLTFNFFYINKKKEMIYVDKDIYELNEKNTILKKELLKIIEFHEKRDGKRFYVYDILKYNDNTSIESILKNKKNENVILENLNKNEDIYLKPNLEFFHSLNSIFVIYKEIPKLHTHKKKDFLHLTRKKRENIINDYSSNKNT